MKLEEIKTVKDYRDFCYNHKVQASQIRSNRWCELCPIYNKVFEGKCYEHFRLSQDSEIVNKILTYNRKQKLEKLLK